MNETELKHQARRKSIKEGIFSQAKTSFGFNYVSPFAIAINSSSSVVALLTAITGFLGPLSEIFGSKLIEKHSRKKIVLETVLFEAIMWLPFVAIAYLYYKGILTAYFPIFLLISFSLYTIFQHLHAPAWFSWMGDIVDSKYRGRWFAKRNLIIGFTSIILTIAAAFFLDFFKTKGLVMLGFITLFSLAAISRIISYNVFRRQYEPKIKLKKGYYFSFWEFLKKAPQNNFGKLAIFRGFFSFTVAVSGALLAVYLLRYLKFSYSIYMIIILSGTLFSLIVMRFWGKLSDKYGNYKILSITTIIIPIIPILWILNSSVFYLIFIPSLLSGICWAGFHLAERNFIYDNVSQQKRGLAVSYYNMLWGTGTFLGAGLGALLIKYVTITSIEPLFLIFIVGAILRMIVVFVSILKLKEIKKTKKYTKEAIKKLILKEAKPTLLEEVHEIVSIKEYLRE